MRPYLERDAEAFARRTSAADRRDRQAALLALRPDAGTAGRMASSRAQEPGRTADGAGPSDLPPNASCPFHQSRTCAHGARRCRCAQSRGDCRLSDLHRGKAAGFSRSDAQAQAGRVNGALLRGPGSDRGLDGDDQLVAWRALAWSRAARVSISSPVTLGTMR